MAEIGITIGIDASNIRAGGGLKHLKEILNAASENHLQVLGIARIVVWASHATLEHLPDYPWLVKCEEPNLNKPLPYRIWWQRFSLDRRLRQLNCDILFVPGSSYNGNFRPFVTISQNMLPFEPSERLRFGVTSPVFWRLLLLSYAQARTFERANGMIFLTDYARQVITSKVVKLSTQSTIIPYGKDDAFVRPPRPQKPLTEYSRAHPFRCLYISIVDVYKHQPEVVKGVAQLRQKGIPIMLDLIGPGYGAELRKLQDTIQRIDPRGEFIHYNGPIPFHELQKWYEQSDVFIFASSCENLPNILLEAMTSGLPIVCSNRGPMPEVLETGGMYFDPENSAEISQVLEAFLFDPVKRASSAKIAYELAQAYSWERCAYETLSFIIKVYRS